MSNYWRLLVAAGLAAMLPSPQAFAHAKLKAAVPAAEAKLAAAPAEIVLTFSETVEPALTYVELDDAAGKVVITSKGTPICDQATCTLKLPALPAGAYKVKFHVLSADGHVVNGGYGFSIGG